MKKVVVLLVLFTFPFSVFAADITEKFSISGTATTVYQWLEMSKGYLDDETKKKRQDRGSAVIDFNVSLRPTENDEFFLRASFAKGSGFKDSSYPFTLTSNADDLFIDLKNINGRTRDHLQELWYSHKFEISKETSLKFTAGIIDSTAFIDDNAFANDELGQFMNEALVNNPLANLPSYDYGVAGEFEVNGLHFRVVGMRSKNEYGRNYNWIGAQVGYKLETSLGEGNYRLYAYTTNKRFLDWDEERYKALKGIGVSFDQEIVKETVGAFLRAGWQDDSAQVDWNRMLSFGLNLKGSVWGRKDDEVGVGYAYLKSPSKADLSSSQVFEGYVKFHLFSYKFLSSDITLDYQYVQDKERENGKKAANIYGVRFNIHF